ncbi:MAG TPA: CARDB domain-containing protein, partial [Bryobacteraceae bacterium]|nr:CARDB domain-containing protein [Bryobacteraceae bacterium]
MQGLPIADGIATLPTLASSLETGSDGLIHMDIKAQVSPGLLSSIAALGGRVESSFARYGAIRAWLPLLAAETLAARPDVLFIRPAERGRASAGPDLNGVEAHAANIVQAAGDTGAGIKIGVLSDGVNSLTAEQTAGRLPSTVTVISGQAGDGDEGTAMLEIVYSMAPGALLYFATAADGESQMASNILALSAAGCEIIVDDYTYFAEPAFQDGAISQAVNTVTSSGALYFSDAQNSGNLDSGTSGTWEGDFVDSGTSIGICDRGQCGAAAGTLNSFGGLNNDTITFTSYFSYYDIQWSDPAGASCNDYDLFILDPTLTSVLGQSTNYQTCTQDPYESVGGDSTVIPPGSRIVIANYLGVAAPRAIHVDTERGQLSINTAGATFGHNAAAATITVAAASVSNADGGAFTGGTANPPESFSSDGPRQVFYNPDGSPITPGNFLFSTGGGTTLPKVDITAADGVTTGLSAYNPFYGTSAAAPHAAAIAALVMSASPSMTAAQIKNAMLSSALPVVGYNARTVGSGIAMANRCVGPIVSTGAASAVTGSGATLGGSVNPNGADTLAWFQYSTNSAMSGSTSTAQIDIGAGTAMVPINANIAGLSGNTLYYFQAWASNRTGISQGSIASFKTLSSGALPDLVVTSLTGPNIGNPGGAINVSCTVLNQGSGSAGRFQLEFYFSPTASPSLGTATDTTWGCSISSLAPSASFTCAGLVGIPAILTPGTWYLAALADAYNQVAESNESNNWRVADTGPVTLGPVLEFLGAGSDGNLYSMSPTTFATALIGRLPTVMSDIAAYNSSLYGISLGSFGSNSVLYTINPNNGSGTAIGSNTGASLNALTFSSSGTLYAAGGNSLYTINTSTGYATLVGSGSGSGTYQSSGDLAFDFAGNLYLTSLGSFGDQLFSLSPATGQGTLIGNIGFSDVYGLAYYNGTAYGFTLGGQVLTINPGTGVGTAIANYTPGFDGTTVFAPAGTSSPFITSPTPGITLSGSLADFSWGAVGGATEYQLTVGTTPGGSNIFSGTTAGTLQTV